MRRSVAKRPVFVLGSLLVLAAGCAGPTEREARESLARMEQQYAASDTVSAEAAGPLPALDREAALSGCLAYAALNNAGLEAAFNHWKAALERVPQARALPDPRFTYRYYIEEVETRVGPQRQGYSLSQIFPWFGKLSLRGGVALEAAEAARERYEAEKLALFYRVKNAYYEYYYLARSIAVVRENRDLLKYLEGVVRRRYTAAAAGHPDVIRVQVELGKLDDHLRTLQDLQGPFVADLNAAMNRPMDAPIPWPTEAPHERAEVTDEEALAWLAEASPELKALEHEIAGRREAVKLAKREYFPDVTVGVDYVDTASALMPGTRDSGKDPVIAMVSVNIPLWVEKYAAGVREAEAQYWAALHGKVERANTLSARAKMVLYRFRDAQRKMDLYGDTLLPKARESLKATETAFRAGRASFTDLVDAERVFLEFQLSNERALASYAQRLAELEMLVGRALPRAAVEPVTGPEDPKTKNENQEGEKR